MNPNDINNLKIHYRDPDLIVIEKPSGLLSVPGRLPQNKDSVALRINAELPQARVVHRLDWETSGLMIMALTTESHRHLNRQFEHRQVKKTYWARIAGQPKHSSGSIDLPLICDWPNRPRQIVSPNGKPARTHWRKIATHQHDSHVWLHPITGRSHQLRVHMATLGHPILGDPLYAPPEIQAAAPRLQLHAMRLRLEHPTTGTKLQFFSDPASDPSLKT